jgi:(p)ppGpp synthase/HD superfamily hydrolase
MPEETTNTTKGVVSDRERRALMWAETLFGGKAGKGSPAPFLSHVYGTLEIVAAYGGEEDLRIAAVLHDVIEDAGVTAFDVDHLFRTRVTDLVLAVTEDKTKSWTERKAAQIAKARECDPEVGMLILADKIHNCGRMAREQANPDYWANFNAGFGDQLWFYQGVVKALYKNAAVHNSDHVTLRTGDAFEELVDMFDRFRKGKLWTPRGLVYAPGRDRAWLDDDDELLAYAKVQ